MLGKKESTPSNSVVLKAGHMSVPVEKGVLCRQLGQLFCMEVLWNSLWREREREV